MSGLIVVKKRVEFKKTLKFLEALRDKRIYGILDSYGKKGVELLKEATPKDTGTTSESWSYSVTIDQDHAKLEWQNSNKGSDGITPVAILIQMGHGTRNGGYVPPTDYINPVIASLQNELIEELSKVVKML